MKRYDLHLCHDGWCPRGDEEPVECADGEWMRVAECERMVREAAARVCDETGLAGLLVDADTIVREVMGGGE